MYLEYLNISIAVPTGTANGGALRTIEVDPETGTEKAGTRTETVFADPLFTLASELTGVKLRSTKAKKTIDLTLTITP